mmetsp:Transcript_2816/g.8420  ORF Transcript_2816/g.8420 Transcript_2816/m.8420 type:complete len:239 (-) Transcript_2816:778-1494(-)
MNSSKSMCPSPEVSTARISSSMSEPSKLSPRTSRSSAAEMRPLLSRSKREKVLRSRPSCAFTRPTSAAARNSLYSISSLLSESSMLKRYSASQPSTWKFSLRAALRSPSLMLPLLRVSSSRNCSLSSACSSVVSDQAIMESAARRKREASAKVRRESTMPASMLELSVRWRPLIQGCSNAWAAVSLSSGSFCSKLRTKVCASSESLLNFEEKWGLPALIFLKISLSGPAKAGVPVRSM